MAGEKGAQPEHTIIDQKSSKVKFKAGSRALNARLFASEIFARISFMKFILGQKIEMSQVFGERGEVIPVTAVKTGPCVVTQVKTSDSDGYVSLQLGFGEKKRISKPLIGHLKGSFAGKEGRGFKFIKEFCIESLPEGAVKGAVIDVSNFQVGDVLTVTGWSKGKGFAGVVKRHHFRGHPTSHGHKDQERMPGSIGAGGIQHVFKGQRMGGHMGDAQTTVKNLKVISVDIEAGIIYIKGALPGARNGLLLIKTEHGDLTFAANVSVATEPQKDIAVGTEEIQQEVAPIAENTTEEHLVAAADAPAALPEDSSENTPMGEQSEEQSASEASPASQDAAPSEQAAV